MAAREGLTRPILVAAVLVAACLAVYARSFQVPFLFDDLTSIPENPRIRSLWPLSRAMTAPPYTTIAGRPLVCLSFAVNYALGGLNVTGYHVVNLALHVACVLMLWWLLRLTLASPTVGETLGRHAEGLAAAIALLWAVHPLATEAVVYVVQRTELLASLFYLLTLLLFALSTKSARPVALLAGSVAACALGALSKEIVVSAPLAVWLYDATFVSGSFGAALGKRKAYYAAMAATWLLVAATLFREGGTIGGVGLDLELGVTPWDYLLTQSRAILHYLRLAFWPHPLRLYYDWPPLRSVGQAWPYLLVIVPLAMAAAWAALRRYPAGFAAALFFMVLAPSSSVVPVPTELVGERRMYLPLAAILALTTCAALVLVRRAGWNGRPALPALVAGVVAAVLAVTAAARVRDYRTEESIWRDTVAKSPRSALVRNNLGRALAAQGRTDEAIAEYREGLRIDPRHAATRSKLGNALAEEGRFEEAAAEYAAALDVDPRDHRTHNNYARVLLRLGRVEAGVRELEAAARLRPDYGLARYNLASMLVRLGRAPEAIPHLEAVAALPDEDQALRARAARDLEALRRASPAR
ncbi:MAG TPA: tetratricopeptide repeat protein [Vicinamibacteria bacterium]|nr:tetratricopeptide repeat protein [Vicinamibacteria bacterium]